MVASPVDHRKIVSGVRAWCRLNQNRYRQARAEDQADVLGQVVETWVRDLRRRLNHRPGSLRYLKSLKIGLRLAGALLDITQAEQADAMAGWQYTQPPANDTQIFYENLYELSVQMGFSVALIESEFPEYKAFFQQEREEYWRKRKELEAVHGIQIATEATVAVTAEC